MNGGIRLCYLIWWNMSVVFDLVILLFLSVTGVFILHVSTHAEHRKKHPVFLVATILLIAWIVVFYGSFIEPKRLVVSEQVVSVSEQDEISLRAVVVADLHVGPYKRTRWAQHVVDRVMSLDPEIIFIPGDFIFSGSDEIQYQKLQYSEYPATALPPLQSRSDLLDCAGGQGGYSL